MALLDSVSPFSNFTIFEIWANGKSGYILPTNQDTYIFQECDKPEGSIQDLDREKERLEKCPVIAYGFVSYWLHFRERKKPVPSLFPQTVKGKTTKEIFDNYIHSLKKCYIDTVSKRADAWKHPNPEEEFFSQFLNVKEEETLIAKSMPLLDYIDEEDKQEFADVMKNFLEYVATRVTVLDSDSQSVLEFYQNVNNEQNNKWSKPIRKQTKVYTFDSPEILKYAQSFTPLQVTILKELITNEGKIANWKVNANLNRYLDSEMWEATWPLYEGYIITAFFECGHVSNLIIQDNGKLAFRKHEELHKAKKKSTKKRKNNKDKSIDRSSDVCWQTFQFNNKNGERNKKIQQFLIALQKNKWLPKSIDFKQFEPFFSGKENNCKFEWLSTPSILVAIFRYLYKTKKYISLPKGYKRMQYKILKTHFWDKGGCIESTDLSHQHHPQGYNRDAVVQAAEILDPEAGTI